MLTGSQNYFQGHKTDKVDEFGMMTEGEGGHLIPTQIMPPIKKTAPEQPRSSHNI
jgi:hypothetical protein